MKVKVNLTAVVENVATIYYHIKYEDLKVLLTDVPCDTLSHPYLEQTVSNILLLSIIFDSDPLKPH